MKESRTKRSVSGKWMPQGQEKDARPGLEMLNILNSKLVDENKSYKLKQEVKDLKM